MIHIHEKEVNKIAEYNLLHDIINTLKRAKILNIRYSPLLHGCMNTRIGRARVKNFQILFSIGCSSKIVILMLVVKIVLKEDDVMQWYTQAGNITTNIKV